MHAALLFMKHQCGKLCTSNACILREHECSEPLKRCLAGSEIHLRRPVHYHLPEDKDLSFAHISEVCRSLKEIAIGYISEAGEVRIAPKGHSIKKYTDSDRILTIGGT